MRGASWTATLELASSLRAHAVHSMVEPGSEVVVTLSPLYRVPPAEGARLSAAAFLVPAGNQGAPQSLSSPVAIDPASLPLRIAAKVPETAAGDYRVEVRLSVDGPSPVSVKPVPIHVEALAAAVQQLHGRVKKLTKGNGSALLSAEYSLTLYDRADAGEVDPTRVKWRAEFAAANAILDDLDAGRDPFAHRRGDMRKAYRSDVDQTLQPYRLFLPESYDGSKPVPLVVALHGMGGDENSMFDSYGGTLKREAARVGFAVVCPKGRDTASMYRGAAGQDVMDVLAEVRRDYKIDPRRIYLMGHSMGGFGTWSVAMDASRCIRGTRPHLRRRQPCEYGEDQPDSGVCGARRRRPDRPGDAVAHHGRSRQEGRRAHRLCGGPGRQPHRCGRAANGPHAGLFQVPGEAVAPGQPE